MKTASEDSIGSRDTNISDESEVLELVAKVKRGNESAFAEIVRRYRRQVASVAYNIVRDYDDAADVTQMVFLKTSQNISRYDEKRRFYTWLYRITVNASIDYLRKHSRHRHEELDVAISKKGHDRENPENNIQTIHIRQHIKAAADKLNHKQKMAFVLSDIEGCPIVDVAGIMEMPEATVRWYLHRARSRVRKELIRRCPHLLRAVGIF
jgi:RNA polymerase sigma-70 factor (ECF subfamily)